MAHVEADAISAALASVDERPTVAAYWNAAREVREHGGSLQPLRVALLASFTVDPLVPFLEVEAARRGLRAEVYVGPYNSAHRELLDESSGCHAHRPDLVFVLDLLEDRMPRLAYEFLTLDSSTTNRLIEELAADMRRALASFRQLSPATVAIANFVPPRPILGIYDATADHSQTGAVRRLNASLADVARSQASVFVLDLDRIAADVGSGWRDMKMWHVGRALLSARMLPALASAQADLMRALAFGARKCLVVDLDDTLWGGVLGEEGPANIKIGPTFPGSVFLDVQRAILELHRRGVLIAINSKNNEADVLELLRGHPDLLLHREHFASTRINWRPKPENMVEIADELNIGIDSLVFLDDSPAERALMRRALPQVLTLEPSPDLARRAEVLFECHAFDALSFTAEDRSRGRMYREEVERREARVSAASLEAFLKELGVVVSIRPVDELGLPRVADLLLKTNQFNLTTRRLGPARLSELASEPNWGVFSLRASDRFGDHGVVGAALVEIVGEAARIDNVVMSCRVIGRSVETALLSFISDWARSRGATVAEGEFIPTTKNAPAADFYARHGFTKFVDDERGTRWCLSLADVGVVWPEHIRHEMPVEPARTAV